MKQILSKINRIENQLGDKEYGDKFEIILQPKNKSATSDKIEIGKKYAIEVKDYMTKPATSTFDFQDKWNDGQPMPFTCMFGTAIKETRGMIYMRLHTDDGTSWGGWVIKSAIIDWEEL